MESNNSEKINILIIDDDIELSKLIKKCMETEGYNGDTVNNGADGYSLIEKNKYQLIILDLMLPDTDGYSLLEKIRKSYNIPVLMLSAKSNEMDKVLGLKSGADDYMTKPFSLSELNARVQALIRRYTTLGGISPSSNILKFNNLIIDPALMRATYNDKDVNLSSKEFELLYFLALNKGQIFTKKQIYQNVWKEEYVYDDNNIMVHIRRLRKKIEPDPDKPIFILTVWGIGYKFNKEII